MNYLVIIRILKEESFLSKHLSKIKFKKWLINELFDWLNIIALTIQAHNEIAQSFLNRIIVNVEEIA